MAFNDLASYFEFGNAVIEPRPAVDEAGLAAIGVAHEAVRFVVCIEPDGRMRIISARRPPTRESANMTQPRPDEEFDDSQNALM